LYSLHPGKEFVGALVVEGKSIGYGSVNGRSRIYCDRSEKFGRELQICDHACGHRLEF
jgi:hypothetical protein